MAAVLRLVRPDNSETINALKELLRRAECGEIQGIAVCFRTNRHEELAAFTGAYRANPERAAIAGMRLSFAVSQMSGEYDRHP